MKILFSSSVRGRAARLYRNQCCLVYVLQQEDRQAGRQRQTDGQTDGTTLREHQKTFYLVSFFQVKLIVNLKKKKKKLNWTHK